MGEFVDQQLHDFLAVGFGVENSFAVRRQEGGEIFFLATAMSWVFHHL